MTATCARVSLTLLAAAVTLTAAATMTVASPVLATTLPAGSGGPHPATGCHTPKALLAADGGAGPHRSTTPPCPRPCPTPATRRPARLLIGDPSPVALVLAQCRHPQH